MNSYAVERWRELFVYPEWERRVTDEDRAQASAAAAPAMARIEAQAKARGMTLDELWQERMIELGVEEMMQHDTSAIEAIGVTPRDVVVLKRQQDAQRRGGNKGRAYLEAECDKALHAFKEVEQEGGTSTDARNRALAVCHKASKKTIDNWLDALMRENETTIERAKRGRPKKS